MRTDALAGTHRALNDLLDFVWWTLPDFDGEVVAAAVQALGRNAAEDPGLPLADSIAAEVRRSDAGRWVRDVRRLIAEADPAARRAALAALEEGYCRVCGHELSEDGACRCWDD